MGRTIAVLVLAFSLSACGQAPGTEQIKQDLSAQLAKAFGTNTFDSVSVADRGSSSDLNQPAGTTRRVTYYDARIRLARDVDFGSWDTPGVASLVTILGAGPKGVRGPSTGGNKAGEEISAHGTAIYERNKEGWRLVLPAGFAPPVAPPRDSISPPSTSAQLVAALQDVVRGTPPGTSPAAQAIVDQELSHAVAAIQARLGRLSQGYPIAAGPEGGQYVSLVQALQATKPAGIKFQALLTEGSVDNLRLLHEGKVLLALAQSDVAAMALTGGGVFAGQGPFNGLRAVAGLFPELVHVIVRSDSAANTLRDLAGKRIGLGPAGSGSRVTAERVLKAHGLEIGKSFEADDKPLPVALVALQTGAIDAVIQIIGVPANQIRAAATTVALKFLPLDNAAIAELARQDKSVLPGVMSRGTYQGLEADIQTLSVVALLTTNESLSDAEATSLVNAIFGSKVDLLSAGSSQASQISVMTARTGISVPLVKGADTAISALADKK